MFLAEREPKLIVTEPRRDLEPVGLLVFKNVVVEAERVY